MKFTFEIPDEDFEEEYGLYFSESIMEAAKDKILEEMYRQEGGGTDDYWYCRNTMSESIKELIKTHKDEIITAVITTVSEQIMKKKEIVEITPKASAIASINKENQAYFEDLIMKAIAKKFK